MISLLLQKPNYASARPSTLLTQDETYNALYVDNQNLDVFYHAAKLGRIVELCLRKSNIYSRAQKNDILFYVLYCIVAQKIGKPVITSSDIKGLDLAIFTDEYILDVAARVFDNYSRLGGDGKVAKGTELLTVLMSSIAENGEVIIS